MSRGAFVVLLVAAGAAFLLLREGPLRSPPESLLGRWVPAAGSDLAESRFLVISEQGLGWSAGPGRVELRELRGVRSLERASSGETFALHYFEDGEDSVLRLQLLPNGRARLGGRRSVEWRRERGP